MVWVLGVCARVLVYVYVYVCVPQNQRMSPTYRTNCAPYPYQPPTMASGFFLPRISLPSKYDTPPFLDEISHC